MCVETAQEQSPQIYEPAQTVPDPEQILEWVEIRCYRCNYMFGKITVEKLTEDKKPDTKIGMELKCKNCKRFTYKNYVV